MDESPEQAKRRDAAWRCLLNRLRAQKPINSGPWTRAELYERTDEEERARRGEPPIGIGRKTE